MALYRHGDLLLQDAPAIPSTSRRLNHLVLAEGELTGHSHRIREREGAELYMDMSGIYLNVTANCVTLIHQEHGPIELPRGVFKVWRQREYFPRDIRTVRD